MLEEVVHIFTTICFQGVNKWPCRRSRPTSCCHVLHVVWGGRRVRRNSGKSFDWLEGGAVRRALGGFLFRKVAGCEIFGAISKKMCQMALQYSVSASDHWKIAEQ